MLHEGQQIELTIEKPASGGRMIARHLGQVILVRGAIPGERVAAWVERAEKRLAYAVTRDVLQPSPDRRPASQDPLCGGLLYSHIAYDRQRQLKADVIRDAFARVGRHPIEQPFEVTGSPEYGYRMRARLHVRGGRAGFYREGTHQLCDAGGTRQLTPAALAALDSVTRGVEGAAPGALASISMTENVAADQRAIHLELTEGARIPPALLEHLTSSTGLTGISAREGGAAAAVRAGSAAVRDTLRTITAGRVADGDLKRHAESFFQSNRYLLPALVTAILDLVPPADDVLDLYAGVGLFSIALAAAGHAGSITAVETDRAAGVDLKRNAGPYAAVEPYLASVEDFLAAARRPQAQTVIVDPPRIGLSNRVAEGLIRYRASRVIYVSCDPPTLARDARKLIEAGYRMESIAGFDFFPNTPHVETLVVFTV
jgi:23S rRNA (uracil1939-C5)-methyltransferase